VVLSAEGATVISAATVLSTKGATVLSTKGATVYKATKERLFIKRRRSDCL